MSLSHNFYCIGNEFTRCQAVLHASVIHGQAITNRNGIELKRYAPSRPNTAFDRLRDFTKVLVPGYYVGKAVDNTDKGFFEIRRTNSQRT